MRVLRLLAAVLLCGVVAGAQEPDGAGKAVDAAKPAGAVARVTYDFVRPGLPVPRFRIVLAEDGKAHYSGEAVQAAVRDGEGGASTTSHVERDVRFSPATTGKIFKAAREERFFTGKCASKAKNIADTGAKTLSYEGPDGRGTCTYNYSENKNLVMLTDLFLGIALTIDEGQALEFKHRYDHLGLDAELDELTHLNDAGRAVELVTIAPILQVLDGDAELMQRVRTRAGKLLERADAGK